MGEDKGYISSENLDHNTEIVHYGISKENGAPGRGSGRYPLGSGDRPRSIHNPGIDNDGHVIRGRAKQGKKETGSKKRGSSKSGKHNASRGASSKPAKPAGLSKRGSSITQLNDAKQLLSDERIPKEKRTETAKQIAKVISPKANVDNIDDAIKLIDRKLRYEKKKADNQKSLEESLKPFNKSKSENDKPKKEDSGKKDDKDEGKKKKQSEKKSELLEALDKVKKWSDENRERHEKKKAEQKQKDEERRAKIKEDNERKMKELAEFREQRRVEAKEKYEAQRKAETEEANKAKQLALEAEKKEWLSDPKKFMEHVADLTPEERQEFVEIQRSKSVAERERVERIANGFAYLNVAKEGLFTALDVYDKVSSTMSNYKKRKTDLDIRQVELKKNIELRKASEEYAKQMKLETGRYAQAIEQDSKQFETQMERLRNLTDYEKSSSSEYLSSLRTSNERQAGLAAYEKSSRDKTLEFVNAISKSVYSPAGIKKVDEDTQKMFKSACDIMMNAYKAKNEAAAVSKDTMQRPLDWDRRPIADYKPAPISYPNLGQNKQGGDQNQQKNKGNQPQQQQQGGGGKNN